jgi:dipeptidyl aminopeptidase/acylaminoacyl peptidase
MPRSYQAPLLACAFVMDANLALSAQTPDPLYQAKGDHERTYTFTEAGIDSPYRIYVPQAWDGKKKLPLVVILHGANLTHDAAFDREPASLKGELFREAEKHGFILVAVEGYEGGSYGNSFPLTLSQSLHPGMGGPPGARPGPAGQAPRPRVVDPTAPELNGGMAPRKVLTPEELARARMLAEADVLNVIRVVSAEYNTDPTRLYMMGNSMGMIGTLHIAQKYPKLLTAIGPSDGPVDPTSYPYETLKGIGGVMIVHGENDPVAPIDDSEVMAYLIKKQGIDTEFVRVPNGGHGDSWYTALPKIFDFFDAHPKRK